jgi:hypothetical protein
MTTVHKLIGKSRPEKTFSDHSPARKSTEDTPNSQVFYVKALCDSSIDPRNRHVQGWSPGWADFGSAHNFGHACWRLFGKFELHVDVGRFIFGCTTVQTMQLTVRFFFLAMEQTSASAAVALLSFCKTRKSSFFQFGPKYDRIK